MGVYTGRMVFPAPTLKKQRKTASIISLLLRRFFRNIFPELAHFILKELIVLAKHERNENIHRFLFP
jgi:hypothetical protein